MFTTALKSAGFFICMISVTFTSLQVSAADHGLFMVVKGSVKVISAKDKKEAPVKVGSKVFVGDTVVTEKDSRAKIVMSDRNVLQLSPESRFEINKYKSAATENEREVQVSLMQGKVRVQVEQKYGEKNKFELRTPTAVAGVRGTEYIAQFNPTTNSSMFVVMSGSVSVAPARGPNAAAGAPAAPPAVLSANMASVVSASEPPQFFKATPAEMKSISDMGTSNSAAPSTTVESPATVPTTKKETAPAPKDEAAKPSAESKSLVTSDMVGGETLKKDSALAREMAPPTGKPVPPVSARPPVVPKAPISNPLVKDVIQNKSSKTRVLVTPQPTK